VDLVEYSRIWQIAANCRLVVGLLIAKLVEIGGRVYVTDALSTMLRLLGEESEVASWLMEARSRMEPVEPCDERW